MLDKAAEYAENAREAVDLAAQLPLGVDRTTLLHMAETWLRLAEAALEHGRFMAASEPADGVAGASAGREARPRP